MSCQKQLLMLENQKETNKTHLTGVDGEMVHLREQVEKLEQEL